MSLAFGVAAAVPTVVVRQLTGSLLLAMAAAALEILVLAGTYSHPRMRV